MAGPSEAARRSWWLREALAAEAATAPGHLAASAAPPLRGTTTADVVVIGGGYTGLWTAYPPDRAGPGARIVLLEADICGAGPSGRNGGFATSWWDELPTLIERYGATGASRSPRPWRRRRRDRRVVRRRTASTPGTARPGRCRPAPRRRRTARGSEAVAACAAVGVGDRYVALVADEVAARVQSPVLARRRVHARRRDDPAGDARPRPAARRCWSVASSSTRGRRSVGARRRAAGRARRLGCRRPARRRQRRSAGGGRVRSASGRASAAGGGEVIAGAAVVGAQRLGRGVAVVRPPARDVVVSYIVLTEPIPDRLADLGWTGGEGLADARFTLHYLRTTPDGRIAIGGGGGRAGFGGRIGAAFTDDARSAARAARRAAAAVPVAARTSASRTPGAARSTSPPTTCRWFGARAAVGRSTAGTATSGNGVAPSLVGGRILAALALERRDDPALALPLVDGSPPRRVPAGAVRYLGARVVREAIVRRETAEERGERRRPGPARAQPAAAADGLSPRAWSRAPSRAPSTAGGTAPKRVQCNPPPSARRVPSVVLVQESP